MNAGRELDALVAEKIFGCAPVWERLSFLSTDATPIPTCACPCKTDFPIPPHTVDHIWHALPRYSQDSGAAFMVVSWVLGRRLSNVVDAFKLIHCNVVTPRYWWASFKRHAPNSGGGWDELEGYGEAKEESLAHAICLASLQSMGAI